MEEGRRQERWGEFSRRINQVRDVVESEGSRKCSLHYALTIRTDVHRRIWHMDEAKLGLRQELFYFLCIFATAKIRNLASCPAKKIGSNPLTK